MVSEFDLDEFIYWDNTADTSTSLAEEDQTSNSVEFASFPQEPGSAHYDSAPDSFLDQVNTIDHHASGNLHSNNLSLPQHHSGFAGTYFNSLTPATGLALEATTFTALNPSPSFIDENAFSAANDAYANGSLGNIDSPSDNPETTKRLTETRYSANALATSSLSDGVPRVPQYSTMYAPNFLPEAVPEPALEPKNKLPPKIGSRFSREAVQVLKRWLALHSREPYPNEEENAILQRQTGLKKNQILNWFANARRRGKVRPQNSLFPQTYEARTEPIDVPIRPGTPAVKNMQDMNPLQRWVDSPPENEAASVTAIAKAVASDLRTSPSSNRSANSPFVGVELNRPLRHASSASSAGTSSGSSLASAHSFRSDSSFGSFASINRVNGRRRRRNRIFFQRKRKTPLTAPLRPYQCTFCPETFRTKHDWQRHEKSLHLSLEKWVCAPNGPRALNPATNLICCAFCGQVDPSEAHIESHNYSVCEAKPFEEKTFYRKDHLNQHLKLVHNSMFLDWCMKSWKVVNTQVKSRCGFCGIVMDSWSDRVEHLAEHFKNGNTISDWTGDWGFQDSILDVLQNAIPPYLIETERNSAYPHTATCTPEASPTTAYELITLELAYFVDNFKENTGSLPNDGRLQYEACRIIFASEALSVRSNMATFSWLRDLVMGSEEIARQAQFAPLRHGVENSLSILKINGKDNLFERCPLEALLNEFVLDQTSFGSVVTDDELQDEACRIIRRLDQSLQTPVELVADWLVRLIRASTAWLTDFRKRVYLPLSQSVVRPRSCPTTGEKPFPSGSGANALEGPLREYLNAQKALGIEPSNEDLGRVVRKIISRSDELDQSAADNLDWLTAFRELHNKDLESTNIGEPSSSTGGVIDTNQQMGLSDPLLEPLDPISRYVHPTRGGGAFENMMKKTFFLNDSNCYRRLAQELTRYVNASMSPNNPNRHVPTDAEIQYQARWILFDSDDPWNQTAADNDEWLRRFKRDAGILLPES